MKLPAGSPSQSSRFARCQLPQSGSPWQSTQTSSLCQGLSLWERWICVAKTERARTLPVCHKFLASTPFPVCKDRRRGGFFLFAGKRRSDSYYQQKNDGIFYKFHKLFFQHLTKFSPFVLAIFIVRAYNFSMLSDFALLQKEAIL